MRGRWWMLIALVGAVLGFTAPVASASRSSVARARVLDRSVVPSAAEVRRLLGHAGAAHPSFDRRGKQKFDRSGPGQERYLGTATGSTALGWVRRPNSGEVKPSAQAAASAPGCPVHYLSYGAADAAPIPAAIGYISDVPCSAGVAQAGRVVVYNEHGVAVDGSSVCQGTTHCQIEHAFAPKLSSFTRYMIVDRRFAGSVIGRWQGANPNCVGYGTSLLECNFYSVITLPDHRCDVDPFTTYSPGQHTNYGPTRYTPYAYPGHSQPLAPFVDAQGRTSRLYWGITSNAPVGPPDFWEGFSYRHIAYKHGWGLASEFATRGTLINGVMTVSGGKYVYDLTGPGYPGKGAHCHWRVIVDPNVRPGQNYGAAITTAFGMVDGEGAGQG